MASIQGVYVALFGRPADPTGLSYFNGVTQNGADLTAIGDLASTQEYQDRFAGQNNSQIVKSIYQSLFNRDPEAAGLDFFVDALNNGKLNINNIAIAILDGAQGTDKTIVDTKIAAADLYTAALDTPTEIGAYMGNDAAASGIGFLQSISTTLPTQTEVDGAVKSMVDAGNVGRMINITAGANEAIVVGGGANDTTDKNDGIFAGAIVNDGFMDGLDDWDFAVDSVDGGFGTDFFSAGIDGAGAVQADGLKSVEILELRSFNNAAALDVAAATDTKEIWNHFSANNLAVTNIALGTTVGISSTTAGFTAFDFAGDGGSSDAAKLAFNGANVAGGVMISDIENFEVNNTGTTSVSVALQDAETIQITGSGSLNVSFAPNTTTETVNAGSFAGTLQANVSNLDALKTFTGSANGDEIITEAAGLTVDQTINGGAGADHFGIANSANSDHTITLVGGAGSDKFHIVDSGNIANVTDAASVAKSLTIIADFNAAEDVIDVTAFGPRGTIDPFEAANIAGQADLKAAASAAASFVGGGESAVFVYGGDTYIFNDVAGAGTFDNGDALIKISGLTDLSDLTAANFLI